MDYFQTEVNCNYVKFNPYYYMGVFTQYSGIRQNKVQASSRWQPKAIYSSAFIAAFSFLKHVYISIKCAVNYG